MRGREGGREVGREGGREGGREVGRESVDELTITEMYKPTVISKTPFSTFLVSAEFLY